MLVETYPIQVLLMTFSGLVNRHQASPGKRNRTSPDSSVITSSPSASRSLVDVGQRCGKNSVRPGSVVRIVALTTPEHP